MKWIMIGRYWIRISSIAFVELERRSKEGGPSCRIVFKGSTAMEPLSLSFVDHDYTDAIDQLSEVTRLML